MSELKTNLDEILQEKQNKIIPGNIKKDVQIFDVIGTYEGSGGTDYNVKLFETEEKMQADSSAQEGDLAIVYREEIQNMTADTQTQFITFPETVTLPEAVTSDYYCILRAIDTSTMFDGNVRLSATSFMFEGFSETGMLMVRYSSTDGINYTRFTSIENPVDLGAMVKVYSSTEWNESMGYFMQTGGDVFEGLYQCNEIEVENDVVKFVPLSSLTITVSDFNVNFSWDGTSIGNYDTTKMREMAQKILTELSRTGVINFYYFIDNDDDLCAAFVKESYGQPSYLLLYKNDNTPHWGINTSSDNHVDVYKVNLEEMSYSLKTTLEQTGSFHTNVYFYIYDIKSKTTPVNIDMRSNHHYATIYWYCSTDSPGTSLGYEMGYYTPDGYESSHDEFRYLIAPTQLSATIDSVYNSTYYGKDGVEEGILTQNVSNSFADINAEVYYKIQQVYNNMEPRVLTDSDKTIDRNIYFIPTNANGEPLLDTSSVTNMNSMFNNCTNLQSIPLLDTSNVTDMVSMFSRCINLQSIPLLDTNQVTDLSHMFNGCTNLQFVPLLDTSSVTNISAMFSSCENLQSVPQLNTSQATNMYSMFNFCISLQSIPLLDTSQATNLSYMFNNCTNLQSVPLLDTSSATDMQSMFNRCDNLNNESLNNILQMCINATKVTTSDKTLKSIGLSETQVQTCATLSNYQAFLDAGWTTGY